MLVDPKLREKGAVDFATYSDSMSAFKKCYGEITPWYVRINTHLDASTNKNDDRPFAYVYVIWQDDRRSFHIFKERWVKQAGHWFTRVVGLVANQIEASSGANEGMPIAKKRAGTG
jgi:hypothetical protein